MNEERLKNAMQLLARFHQIIEDIKPSVTFLPASGLKFVDIEDLENTKKLFIDKLDIIEKLDADSISPEIRDEYLVCRRMLLENRKLLISNIDRLQAHLGSIGLNRLKKTLIHGDYHTLNLRFRGNKVVGVLDWDFFRGGALRIVDLSSSITNRFESAPVYKFDIERFKRAVKYYSEVFPLTDAEIDALSDAWRIKFSQDNLNTLLNMAKGNIYPGDSVITEQKLQLISQIDGLDWKKFGKELKIHMRRVTARKKKLFETMLTKVGMPREAKITKMFSDEDAIEKTEQYLRDHFKHAFPGACYYLPALTDYLLLAASGKVGDVYDYAEVVLPLIEKALPYVENINHYINMIRFILGINPDNIAFETKENMFKLISELNNWFSDNIPAGFKIYLDKEKDDHIFHGDMYVDRFQLEQFPIDKTNQALRDLQILIGDICDSKVLLSQISISTPSEYRLSRGIQVVNTPEKVTGINMLLRSDVEKILPFLMPNRTDDSGMPVYDLVDPVVNSELVRPPLARAIYEGSFVQYAYILFLNSQEFPWGMIYQDAIWHKKKQRRDESRNRYDVRYYYQQYDPSFRLYAILQKNLPSLLERGMNEGNITEQDKEKFSSEIGYGSIVYARPSTDEDKSFACVYYQPFLNEGDRLTPGAKWIFKEILKLVEIDFQGKIDYFDFKAGRKPQNATYSGNVFDISVKLSKGSPYSESQSFLSDEEVDFIYKKTLKDSRDVLGSFAKRSVEFTMRNSNLPAQRFKYLSILVNRKFKLYILEEYQKLRNLLESKKITPEVERRFNQELTSKIRTHPEIKRFRSENNVQLNLEHHYDPKREENVITVELSALDVLGTSIISIPLDMLKATNARL